MAKRKGEVEFVADALDHLGYAYGSLRLAAQDGRNTPIEAVAVGLKLFMEEALGADVCERANQARGAIPPSLAREALANLNAWATAHPDE